MMGRNMIPDQGALQLAEYQTSGLNVCEMWLFTSNTTITTSTVIGDLTAAAWTGYAPVALTSWSAATIVGGRAQKTSTITAQFNNTSGSSQTYYGWAIVDPVTTKLIAAVNLGAQVIPDGLSAFYVPYITDKEE